MPIVILFIAMIAAFCSSVATPDVPLEVLRLRAKEQKPLTTVIHTHTIARPRDHYAFYPGSLKENISHLAHQCGWSTVVWQPSYDYQWVGATHFAHKNIKEILGHVLKHFPLQAVFYEGNHVLVITPRNLS